MVNVASGGGVSVVQCPGQGRADRMQAPLHLPGRPGCRSPLRIADRVHGPSDRARDEAAQDAHLIRPISLAHSSTASRSHIRPLARSAAGAGKAAVLVNWSAR